jgi:hypothetical protein
MLPAADLPTVAFDAAATEAVLRACLAEFRELRWRVTGTCMQPRLPDGAGLVLMPPTRRGPRFGDVVLVRQDAGLLLHRLVWPPWPVRAARGAARMRTMADRARALDPVLARHDVLAVVQEVQGDPSGRPIRAPWLAVRLLARALRTCMATRLGVLRAAGRDSGAWRRDARRA